MPRKDLPFLPRGTEQVAAGQNQLSTTAEVVLAATERRVRATILNMDASITIYLGEDSGVTSSNGFPLAAGQSFSVFTEAAVYAVAASGTPTIATWEEYE